MSDTAPRIALLAPTIAAQLQSQAHDRSQLDVVWSGEDVNALIAAVAVARPAVIVADLERLGDDAPAAVRSILKASGAELIIVAYTFARREDLRRLEGERVRVVRAPISVDSLKLAMMSVLVRGILNSPAPSGASGGAVPPPRFNPAQLGKLQEVSSAIQCECPNHVAVTLIGLRGFEDYSRSCIDRDAKDAAVHRMLYERTGAARAIMEEALVELLKHESIVL
jgi:hypothetical protein